MKKRPTWKRPSPSSDSLEERVTNARLNADVFVERQLRIGKQIRQQLPVRR